MPWDGIMPAARRLLMGTAAAPKAKRIGEPSTPASSTYYEGMNQDYRWFRQNEIVRRCIVANAFFSTTAAGFETVLDSEGSLRLVNDVRLVIFEEETQPRDGDAWTESAEGWSSPDPTDTGYPQSDSGDKVSGTASIHSNTTGCGSQYRLRLSFGEVDVAGYDQLRLWVKYGSGSAPRRWR